MVASRGSTPATDAAEERRNGHGNISGSCMTPLGVSPVGDEKQDNGEKEGDVWRARATSAAELRQEEGEGGGGDGGDEEKGMQGKEVTEVVLDAGDALTAKEALLQVWCHMVVYLHFSVWDGMVWDGMR